MRHTELKEISQDTQRIHEEFKQKHKKILVEDVQADQQDLLSESNYAHLLFFRWRDDTAIIILIHEVQVQFGKDLYKMQFMTGDNSSVNFECRNQHVEHYSCLGCYGHLNPSHDLTYKT